MAIYHRFRNRESLLQEVTDREFDYVFSKERPGAPRFHSTRGPD
jgi:hypothetical protein